MSESIDSQYLAVSQVEQPLISVIVPIYNTEPYLRRCLESIARQTHDNLQVICVDDGSTDKSRAVCEEFSRKDRRFSYVYQENRGQSAARNRGVSEAIGDYIAFIDSDDYWEANILEKLLHTMLENNAEFVMCQVVHEGFPNLVDPILDWDRYSCSGVEMVGNVLLSRNGFSAAAHHALFSGSIVRQVHFLEGHVFEDLDYLVRIALLVNRAITISDRLYHYCWREMNSSARPIDLRVDDMRAITRSLEKLISTKCPEYLIELDQRVISNMLGLAQEAVWSSPGLFEELRSDILARQFVTSLQVKSNCALWKGIVHGRLTFAIACTLYSVFKFAKALIISRRKSYVTRRNG